MKTRQWKPRTEPRGDFYYIDVSAVSNDTFTITSPQAVTGKTAPGRARKIVHARDVIYATIRPTLRRIALVPSASEEIAIARIVWDFDPGILTAPLSRDLFTNNFIRSFLP